MAVDIRIGSKAFEFADAWLTGVARGVQRSQLDLQWASWADSASARLRGEVRDQAAFDAAQAARNSALGARDESAYQADVAAAAKFTAAQSDKANYIMARLVNEHGFTRQGAAALVGNWLQESQLSTIARNRGDGSDGSDSIGLAQWNAQRSKALKAYAAARGTSWTDLNTQVDFAAQELTSGNYRAVGDMLRDSRVSLAAASQAVHRKYEVAEPTSAGRRLSFSMGVFNKFDPSADSSRTLPVIGADGTQGVYSNFPVAKEPLGPTQAASADSTIPGSRFAPTAPLAPGATVRPVRTRPMTDVPAAGAPAVPGATSGLPGLPDLPGAAPASAATLPANAFPPLPAGGAMSLPRLEDALDPFGARFRAQPVDPMQRYYDADKEERLRMREPSPLPPLPPVQTMGALTPSDYLALGLSPDEQRFDPYAYYGRVG